MNDGSEKKKKTEGEVEVIKVYNTLILSFKHL